MSARYVSSSLLKNVKSKSGKQVALEVVDRTTSWSRPSGFPSEGVKQEFVEMAQNNTERFKPEVVKIAMKESEHQSDKDKRMHYTAYGLDENGSVVDVQHLTRYK